MEFLDEDARPRFLLQSRPQQSSLHQKNDDDDINLQKPTKIFLFLSISISSLLFVLSFFYFQSEPYKSLLCWLSLSILVGPFAPSHVTGGHTRVGHGPVLEPPVKDEQIEPETKKKPNKNRSLIKKSQDFHPSPVQITENTNSNGSAVFESKEKKGEALKEKSNGVGRNEEEKEWSEEDVEILKKQMVKNPVGKPKRWEAIAEAFNGRHRVGSVIKKAKDLGEKKVDDTDSYAKFLKNRKVLDARIQDKNEGLVVENGEQSRKDENENNDGGDGGGGGGGSTGGWSAGEDIALLNALKSFPKDVSMRWEKIAAAVPGKSKAACMKRVAELKRDFRSSKAGADS